tara:strand:+ start:8832 stop:9455 length:624 start_codon:yes stop_codon:yes gene_type:complete
MSKQKNNNITYALICVLLFIGLMYWTNRMFVNNYIRETFADGVTHTVNMPINTTSSCKNMCGPPNRCSITGTECLSDIDCYGCQPNTSPDLSNTFLEKNKKISGYSQAGKLSFLAPDYSPLIHDIGTKSKPLQGDPYIDPPSYNWGFDEWTKKNINMRTVYDKRYEVPPKTVFLSTYPPRPSVTGEYMDSGPFASNATLVSKEVSKP